MKKETGRRSRDAGEGHGVGTKDNNGMMDMMDMMAMIHPRAAVALIGRSTKELVFDDLAGSRAS